MQVLRIQNREQYNYRQTFKEIPKNLVCSQLCGAKCCRHSIPVSGNFKLLIDLYWLISKLKSPDPKKKSYVQRDILKWFSILSNEFFDSKLKEANDCISAILAEKNKDKIKQLGGKLYSIDKKFSEACGENELFIPITNPEAVNLSANHLVNVDSGVVNICPCLDKTNRCTIFNGIPDEHNKNTIIRPRICSRFGDEEDMDDPEKDMTCLWIHPERLNRARQRIEAYWTRQGIDFTSEDVDNYMRKVYSLDNIFEQKILPSVKSNEI